MTNPKQSNHTNGNLEKPLADTVGQQAQRKQRARNAPKRPVWFGLGMFGLVGWSVVMPALAGIALGIWLDGRWEGEVSWTLTFLIIGVLLGCINAWYWLDQERKPKNESKDSVSDNTENQDA